MKDFMIDDSTKFMKFFAADGTDDADSLIRDIRDIRG